MHSAFAQQGSAATAASGATGSSSPSGVAGTSGTSGTSGSANASGAAAGGKSVALNSADKTFLMEAAKGGMTELSMSQMAQQKGSSNAAKQFAARMIEDHTKANDGLKQLASSKGVTLPTAPPDAAMAKAKKMQGMSGAAFDKRYMAEMLPDHKKVVTLFEKQARSTGGDADINAFARQNFADFEGTFANGSRRQKHRHGHRHGDEELMQTSNQRARSSTLCGGC